MIDAPQVPRSFEGVQFWRKWQETLRFARREEIRLDHGGLRTRISAFGPLQRPVFILGSPRSGTTYLGSLLAAMPEATYFFEPPIMKYYARLIYEDRVSFPQVRRFYYLGFRSLLLAAPGSGPRIVEKNPNHTWVAETLLAVFPTAQFVVIVRDGRDTALSLSEQPWHRRDSLGSGKREPGGYSYGPHPHFYIEPERAGEFATTSDFHRCVWIWRRHTEEIERLRNAIPSRSWHELRYETLIEEPNEVLDELLSFLGEETTVARRALRDAARSGHRRSIGRWRSHLTREDLAVVAAEAGPLLRRLGYS